MACFIVTMILSRIMFCLCPPRISPAILSLVGHWKAVCYRAVEPKGRVGSLVSWDTEWIRTGKLAEIQATLPISTPQLSNSLVLSSSPHQLGNLIGQHGVRSPLVALVSHGQDTTVEAHTPTVGGASSQRRMDWVAGAKGTNMYIWNFKSLNDDLYMVTEKQPEE